MNHNSPRFKIIIDKVIDMLESKLENKMHEIWLFGSLARNEGKITSDVDIMVNMIDELPERDLRFSIYDEKFQIDNTDELIDIKFCVNGVVETYSRIFNESVMNDKIVLKRYNT